MRTLSRLVRFPCFLAAAALTFFPLHGDEAGIGGGARAAPTRQSYRNPILAGDWSDPDVIRVGQDFYLTASSFVNVPGLPILHSRDLVHWSIIGHALERLPQDHYRTPRKGGGVWAPAIRFHDGAFRIYYPDPDYGIFVVTARDPRGPWSAPELVDASRGAIDPAPFWDEDGSGWLLHGWAKSRAGFANRLTLKRLDAAGKKTVDAGVTVIDGEALKPVMTSIGNLPWRTVEGPKLYKRDGWYYIFAPAGGVKVGWQAVFRARSLAGPYEARNVMDQGGTAVNGPHQGAWVDTGTGEDWFLHFQDSDSYGRRVHLQPMAWKDGWPTIGVDTNADGVGEPVTCHAAPQTQARSTGGPQDTDLFESSRLSPAWQWNSNPGVDWASLTARPGWLRLTATPMSANLYEAGALLTQKLPAPDFSATVKLAFAPRRIGESAGLGMFGDAYAWIGLERRPDGIWLVRKQRPDAVTSGPERVDLIAKVDEAEVRLQLLVRAIERKIDGPAEQAPWPSRLRSMDAEVTLGYSVQNGPFRAVPGTFISKPGRWVGAQIGLFAVAPSGSASFAATDNGHADFDDFIIKASRSLPCPRM